MKEHFLLRSDITFLNFGSFGACPKPVFEEYQAFQRKLEEEPVHFFMDWGPLALKESRASLAQFIHCQAQDLLFVPNPTHAVNLVANSMKLQEGDEVLATSLEYGACDRTWQFFAKEKGFRYVQQAIRLPIESREAFVSDFFKGFSDKTKGVFISHITSSTGLRLPLEEIIAEAKRRGCWVFVDGAHAPGHIPLDLSTLGADFYTGACHKWMMAPKGCSFLWTHPSWQNKLKPLLVSWGYEAAVPGESQYYDWHQFNGTRDYTAYLCIPACLRFFEEQQFWQKIDTHKTKVREYVQELAQILGSKALAPLTDDFFGLLASVQVQTPDPMALKNTLYQEHKIQLPIMPLLGQTYMRFSFHPLNTEKDILYLFDACKKLLESGLILKN